MVQLLCTFQAKAGTFGWGRKPQGNQDERYGKYLEGENVAEEYDHANKTKEREEAGSLGIAPKDVFKFTSSRISENPLLQNRICIVFILNLYAERKMLIYLPVSLNFIKFE